MAAGPARTSPMPGHQHPRPRVVVTQFAIAVAASLKRGSMKPPGADPVMTPRDHGAGGSVGHHQHAASRCPGCGGRHGHRGQPEGPPCRGPGRRARHAGVPGAGTGRRADARLAAAGEARPSQNPLFCAPEACRGCHQSLARNRRYWPGMQHCGVADLRNGRRGLGLGLVPGIRPRLCSRGPASPGMVSAV